MSKDKLVNDTTSVKIQSDPIKVAKLSDSVEGNNNPFPEGDSSSEHTEKVLASSGDGDDNSSHSPPPVPV